MSTSTPTLPFGAQLIGRTEKSLNAILQRILVDGGLSEPEYVAMRVCAEHTGAQRLDLEGQLAVVFRKGKDQASSLLDSLTGAGIIATDATGCVALTPTGRDLRDRMAAETDAITARLWGDLAADDLAVAGRVLSTVLQRAAGERA